MQLLITGAASSRGQATIVAALRQGHSVYAVLSPTEMQPNTISPHPNLTWGNVDWLEESGKEGRAALQGMDAVIHIDEVQSGPFERHYLGTVQTTERLIQAMVRNQVRRLILISSLAIYRYEELETDQVLDETSPLEFAVESRPAYVQAKLMQEALLSSFNICWGGQATILRPGLDYSREQLWQSHLGVVSRDVVSKLNPTDSIANTGSIPMGPAKHYWQISPKGQLPLLYTEHFASAAIAALHPTAIGETFNLVDDHLPSRIDYGRAIAKIIRTPQAIPVPWKLATAAEQMQRRMKLLRLPFSHSWDRRTLDEQFKPLRYSNAKAKRILNWQPTTPWQFVLGQSAVGLSSNTLISTSRS